MREFAVKKSDFFADIINGSPLIVKNIIYLKILKLKYPKVMDLDPNESERPSAVLIATAMVPEMCLSLAQLVRASNN